MIAPTDLTDHAERFKLLGHPVRLQILDVLRRSPECVCHLEALLGKPQPYVSQQLRLLREGGLIDLERQGQNIYYHLADATVGRWLETVLGPVDGELPEMVRHKRVLCCPCPQCNDEPSRPSQPVVLTIAQAGQPRPIET